MIIAVVVVLAATGVLGRLGSQQPGSAPPSGLAHYSGQGLSFAYPAAWKVHELDLALHYEDVLAYLGSGSGTMTCGSDYIPGAGGTCDQQLMLGPDSVVIKVSRMDGPPTPHGWVAWTLSGDAGAVALTVGGQPAARSSAAPDVADSATQWTISRPGDMYVVYTLVAYVKGPDVTAEQAQVQALIDSIAIAP
ncbi:MAG TPA: hypothetical protein VFW92_11475 [Candidatus Limnocylindrales bacterium]|nr:hypothetical protein [Candidatus Limnocylindrales bacterium]